jgi:dTDP-4-amino-4,6-dideoxygalactose transaminase
VDLRTRNATAEAYAAAIGPKTRALMPVHFAGLAVDLDGVYALAQKHGLRVIEDAAHAIGTAYKGRKVGSFGDVVVFSFHPNKNMTTIEGGAISYADASLTRALDLERFHGIEKDADGLVDVFSAGGKYNLSDVAAAIGLGQLPKLDGWNAKRRSLAARYFERLEGALPDDWLPARGDAGHSWHIYTVLIPFAKLGLPRAQFNARMRDRGFAVGMHYPSMPALTYYRTHGADPARFPNAGRIGAETVTLPLFPKMGFEDVDRVCDALLDVVGKGAR